MDYSKFYNLEDYLFNVVSHKFSINGYLDALDFFCIIIWKANRAKSKTAKRLIKISDSKNLDKIVKEITEMIHVAKTNEQKLVCLLGKWKFRLPMASAILTVLYPKIFTVYDVRVCKMLNDFHNVQNKSIKTIWHEYEKYVDAVRKEVPAAKCLREKDRYLWGKSFFNDLNNDLLKIFK